MNFEPMKAFMQRLTDWRIPGNSIRVYQGHKEIFRWSTGYADLESGRRMQGDELFNIYSCSKVCTVTAALQLLEKGYFLLDDPLYDFIPAFREMTIRGEDGELRKAKNPITMRHLFTMTAGLTYNMKTEAFDRAREITGGSMDTLQTISCLASDPLSFEPGERWQYSLCHDVLAAAVGAISGMKFRDYVRKNIFEPLGMNDSYYHNEGVLDRMATLYRFVDSDEQDLVKLQSQGHTRPGGHIEKEVKRVVHVVGPEYDSGGAGITTSVDDYGEFVAALANGGLGRNGERILSAGSVELLRTNQLTPAQLQTFSWSQLKGYGYGLGVRTLIDRAAGGSTGSLGEFGWGGAAGATVLVDPDRKLSLFYAHHMLNPQEHIYQPRLRNVLYACMED